MKPYQCPKCKEECIPAKDKYKAGIWRVIHCPQCGARLCGQPWVMAASYTLYVWALAWFGFWAYMDHSWEPLLYLIPVWLLLDLLNMRFMPLSILRARKTSKPDKP